MLSLLSQIFNAIKQLLATYETSIKNRTTTEVVKDKKQLKKASNITEEILEITDKYIDSFEKDDKKDYGKLKKRFLKFN